MLARFVANSGHLSEVNLNNFVSTSLLLCSELNKWEQFSLSNFDASSGNLAAGGGKP